MAILQIGGRRQEIACRDGDEARLEALGRVVDAKVRVASAGMGNVNEARQLLFAALLLADELGEAKAATPPPQTPPPPPPSPPAAASAAGGMDPELVPLLLALADHLEGLAERLEKPPAGT